MSELIPEGISKECWGAFKDWFLAIPDVDETLIVPDKDGLWHDFVLQTITGFNGAFNRHITLEQARKVIEEAGMVCIPVGGRDLVSLFWGANPGLSCGDLDSSMESTKAMIKAAQKESGSDRS
jgi:hypothetical protein